MRPAMTPALRQATMVVAASLGFVVGTAHGDAQVIGADTVGAEAVEVRRIPAPEAHQGVAADGAYLYVVDNRTIGKYDKGSGERVGGWEGSATGPIRHLNAGLVRDGLLYAVHSNYPELPMASSIEIFHTESMEHVGSHSFGIHGGSATWLDLRDGDWWVAFVHYENQGGLPDRGVEWSTLERFDTEWRRKAGYVFPPALVDRFRPWSNSGGIWTRDGLLYLTGHDEPELYVVRLPRAGSELEWIGTIPAPIAGQGIAADPDDPHTFYGIDRASREVVVFRVVEAVNP